MPNTATTISTGKPDATETGHVRFGKGPSEKDPTTGTSSAAYFTSRTDLWDPGGASPPGYPTCGDHRPLCLIVSPVPAQLSRGRGDDAGTRGCGVPRDDPAVVYQVRPDLCQRA